MRQLAIVLVLFIVASCKKDVDPITATDFLTANIWDKPEVLHQPPLGVYTTNSCSETYEFKANGDYKFTNHCNPVLVIDGNWAWVKDGEEIRLETSLNGIPQHTFRILILELTQNTLHTKQMVATEPLNTVDYWEFIYKAK